MAEQGALRRVLSLPWLVAYGVGVTVGAGIFALIAEIVGVAGDHAAYAFLAAGVVAAVTAYAYALLARAYPHAAGAAFFVRKGLGKSAGLLVGYGVVATAIASSAVIALAFSRHVESFSGFPQQATLIVALAGMAAVALAGVRESIGFAAIVTALEVGTLLVVIVVGLPLLGEADAAGRVLLPPTDASAVTAVLAGAFVAFFAFIGFEDIVNMAEETVEAQKVIPQAILLTLIITLVIYGTLAAVAAAYPDRGAFQDSEAPLAELFAGTTGLSGTPIAVMAALAMVNGILVQIIMASRLLYGMAHEDMAPAVFARLLPRRKTPVVGILVVAAIILGLALAVPLLSLAELTSFIVLAVFTMVNVSLFLLGRKKGEAAELRARRWWGLVGAALSIALLAAQVADQLGDWR